MPMRDWIIPFRFGGADSIELKYALRSIDKFDPECNDVFLVTDEVPIWCFCPMVKFTQNSRLTAVSSVLHKIKAACLDPRVSDTFVLSMDDVYLVDKFLTGPFYMKGSPTRNDGGIHHKGFQLAFDELDRRKVKTRFDGELHAPIVIQKEKALDILNNINIDLPYSFRTLYVNLLDAQLAPQRDSKVFTWKAPEKGMWFWSTNDSAIAHPDFKKWANALFPKKSRWEA